MRETGKKKKMNGWKKKEKMKSQSEVGSEINRRN